MVASVGVSNMAEQIAATECSHEDVLALVDEVGWLVKVARISAVSDMSLEGSVAVVG